MNIVDNSGKGLAALGRNEDRFMAHVAKGEMVVPPVISDKTKNIIKKEMMAAGLDPQEYEVGAGMSINPITGQPEFGFLKKIAKSVKKVVKKVAPIAAVIPGPWQPFAAVYQKGNAALKLAKGEGGLGDILTLAAGGNQSLFGEKGAFKTIGKIGQGGGAFTDITGTFGDSLKAIGQVGGELRPFEYIQNIGRAKASDLKQGFGGLFGGNVGRFNVNTGMMEYLDADGNITTDITKVARQGFNPLKNRFFDNMPKEVFVNAEGDALSREAFDKLDATEKAKYSGKLVPQSSGISRAVLSSQDGSATAEQIASQQSPFREFLDDQLGFDPSGKSGIYKFLPGGGGEGGMGGSLALAGLAALYGKVVKEAAEKTQGGLTDIRQSARPDLNPAPVFAGFDLGIRKQAAFGGPIGYGRQYFNQGGLAAIGELDMRQGGESVGPGTGTSDDIPAMLSDGEFVMTAAANNGSGGFKFNKTKKGIELIAGGKPDREKGVDVMTKLMKTFEDYNKIGRMA